MKMLCVDLWAATACFAKPKAGPGVWLREEPTMPAWSKLLAKHSEAFNGSVMVVQREHGACDFWKVVFAIQSFKYYLALYPLHIVPTPPVDERVLVASF